MPLFEFTVDSKLRIVEWNKELEKGHSHPKDLFQGRPYYEVLPRICYENTDAVSRVLNCNEPLNIKGYRFPCFYDAFEADVTIVPVEFEGHNGSGAQVSIKTYKQCDLANRLQQSQHLIDIGKIASTLAHGVRNPLNAIKGAAVYLQDQYAHEKTLLEFTKIMEEEISRLDRFITSFLSASLSDSELAEIDINSLIRKLKLFTSLQAQTSRIEISCKYGKVKPLMLNPFQIEQAILNVINNAISAMPTGGEIVIATKTEEFAGARFAVVEISDTGPGMPESAVRGCSAPLPETAADKGKGFGLFIAREILQHHDGRLEIKSEKGKGTTVKMYLPLPSGEEF